VHISSLEFHMPRGVPDSLRQGHGTIRLPNQFFFFPFFPFFPCVL